MSNLMELKSEIMTCLFARTPLVIIDTNERERVEKILHQLKNEAVGVGDVYYYTDSGQVRVIGKSEETDTNDDPLGFFLSRMKKNRKMNIVLGDVQNISGDTLYARDLVSLLYQALATNSVVMIITSDSVWERIRGFGITLTLDLPNEEERYQHICSFIDRYKTRFTIEWTDEDAIHASALLRGFTEIQIENILSTEIISQNGLRKIRIPMLDRQKRRLYGKADAIQYIEVDPTLEISGMKNLRQWLQEKKQIFFMRDEILKKHDLKTPKGILLVGVPGCGKSLTAKMIANEWGLPLFRFDIGSVFDKWVGGSERRMRESLRFIENVSPCIVWIDEIEKGISNSTSDNETSRRVLGEFLFWMQESSAKVFMVATANQVKSIPYEMYRKGRFSELFFAGLPDMEERKEMLKMYLKRSLGIELPEEDIDKIAKLIDGFSNSDIEAMIKETTQRYLLKKDEINLTEALIRESGRIVPISKVNPELVTQITDWAKGKTLDV